jgi:amino-acid N-acetyltransferase
MESTVRIRAARPEDFEFSQSLLRDARLPLEGLDEWFRDAIVADQDRKVVGCVALEMHDHAALLRSLVVAPALRGRRLGERLTKEALSTAKQRGATDVYLLTETARDFFEKFGFRVEDRASAPAGLQESVEFRSACPSSATMMRLKLEG